MRSFPILCLLLFTAVAHAEPARIRIGDHSTYGRIVILLPAATDAPTVKQTGDHLEISLPAGFEVPTPDAVPRNILSLSGGRGSATLTILSGARIKTFQEGNVFVLDAVDPPERAKSAASTIRTRWNPAFTEASPVDQEVKHSFVADQTTAPANPATPVPDRQPPSLPSPVLPSPVLPSPVLPSPVLPSPVSPSHVSPSHVLPTPSADSSLNIASSTNSPREEPKETAGEALSKPSHVEETMVSAQPIADAIHVSAGPEVGAVAFRRGEVGVVVFDEVVEPLLSDQDVARGHIVTQQLQRATIMTIPLSGSAALALSRQADGWMIMTGAGQGSPVALGADPKGIAFPFAQPGRALAISDPMTGQVLLLGTTRAASGKDLSVESRRSGPGYAVLPTWLGLAVEANSDKVDLTVSLSGFRLQIPDNKAPEKAVAALQENEFGIPRAPQESLSGQLNAQIASAAVSPPRGRGPQRLSAARTMLALGMAAEAEALLVLAANDDPAIAGAPTVAALTGVAAVLAGRPTEASSLDNPALPTTDEIALWRGLRDVEQGKSAPALANMWASIGKYPEAIQRQIAPTVIEAAIKGGIHVPASATEGASFAFARALQTEMSGDIDGALAAFSSIEKGRDEKDSVRAAVAGTELRLSKGLITPTEAADLIERQTVRWRGDTRELGMRLKSAELRSQAGQWRAALESLQRTETLFPDTTAQVASLKTGVFRSLLSADSKAVKPLELVTIANDFADCIPDGPDGERLAGLLADKLAALDLPSRAIPVLKRLLERSETAAKQDEFALRLAQLQLDAGEAAKASALLAGIDAGHMDPASLDHRTILLARAKAEMGDSAGAAEALAALDNPEAEELRATLLAKAGNWQGSLKALESIAAKSVPEQGPLSDKQQDLVLRQATAAVQAGDTAALVKLRRYEPMMMVPRADLFRVLTASAVQSAEDLPRSARELAVSKRIPERLSALKLR